MKMSGTIKKLLILFQIILVGLTVNLPAQTLREIESQIVSLPNGWKLTPAGKLLPLGDLPLNIAVSSSKKTCSYNK